MTKKKYSNYKQIANGIIIILATFMGLLFFLNEQFDLNLKAQIILPLTAVLATGFIFLSKKVNMSNYLLMPAIMIDGFFHLTSPLENLVQNSPDWVIAFNFYGGNGMPVIVHQIMGVFLLLTVSVFIYHLIKKQKNWYYYFFKYVIAVITLLIISTSYVIQLFK